MTSRRFPTRFVVLAAVAVFAFLAGVGEARDADLGFHLATGRAIRAAGHMLDHNPLTFIQPSPPWVVSQGVSAALFDWIAETGGIGSLILFKATIIALTFAILIRVTLRLGASLPAACGTVVLACLAASVRFVERPLVFSNLIFVMAMAGLIEAGYSEGWRRWAWLGGVALVVAIGCQLHAGIVFSFVLLGIVAVSLALEPVRTRHTGKAVALFLPVPARAGLAMVAVAMAAAGLGAAILATYHPFPLRALEIPFVMGTDRFLAEHLAEFRTPFAFPITTLGGFWIVAVLGVASLVFGARRLPLALSLTGLAFLGLAFRHARFVDLYALAITPVLALGITSYLADGGRRTRIGAWSLLAAAVLLGISGHIARTRLRLGYSPEVFGKEALDFVEAEHLSGPAFVSDGWAGPFLARFFPREQVFFFPAFDAFLPEHYRQYMDIRYGKPGWDAHLDRLGIELCVLKYTSPKEREFQGGSPNLRQLLAHDSRWVLLYFDDLGEIFVRRTGRNAAEHPALIRERAITGFDPDRMQWFRPDGTSRTGLAALAARQGTPSQRVARAIEALSTASGR